MSHKQIFLLIVDEYIHTIWEEVWRGKPSLSNIRNVSCAHDRGSHAVRQKLPRTRDYAELAWLIRNPKTYGIGKDEIILYTIFVTLCGVTKPSVDYQSNRIDRVTAITLILCEAEANSLTRDEAHRTKVQHQTWCKELGRLQRDNNHFVFLQKK